MNISKWSVLLCITFLLLAGCKSSGEQTESDSKPTAEASGESSSSAESSPGESSSESGDHAHAHADESKQDGDKKPHGHRFDDPEKYADDWNDPARDKWQKPQEVMDMMELEAGMTVADLGTGTGYFVPHLSERVGPEGKVLALDIEEEMVEYVRKRADKLDLNNVEARKVEVDDPGLAKGEVDAILTVNTWHHIPDRVAYVKKLREATATNGVIAVVDYTKEADRGPPKSHRLDPEQVLRELREGGFTAAIVDESLPKQFVVMGQKTDI